jgi:hypothetical protein
MNSFSSAKEIDLFITSSCQKLASSECGWETLFFESKRAKYWVKSYPNSYMHGGGEPNLSELSENEAKERFGI